MHVQGRMDRGVVFVVGGKKPQVIALARARRRVRSARRRGRRGGGVRAKTARSAPDASTSKRAASSLCTRHRRRRRGDPAPLARRLRDDRQARRRRQRVRALSLAPRPDALPAGVSDALMAKIRRQRRKNARPSTQPRPTRALIDGTFRWLKLDDNARSFRAMHAFAQVAGRAHRGARARRADARIDLVRALRLVGVDAASARDEGVAARASCTRRRAAKAWTSCASTSGRSTRSRAGMRRRRRRPSRRRKRRRRCPRRSRARSAASRIRSCATHLARLYGKLGARQEVTMRNATGRSASGRIRRKIDKGRKKLFWSDLLNSIFL